MKPKMFVALVAISLLASLAHAQGVFLYDQQSATDENFAYNGAFIEAAQPIGQSFTPTLTSVGFVQLRLSDTSFGNGLGVTAYVNLWSESLGDGMLLGSTEPLIMPDGFSSLLIATFLFSTPVAVTPGTTYYFQPIVVQDGGEVDGIVWGDLYNYSGGTAYLEGAPSTAASFDLWFREGVVVPEPASVWLALVGAGLWVYVRRFQQKQFRS